MQCYPLLKQKEQKEKTFSKRENLHIIKNCFSAISDLAIDDVDKDEANLKFARSVNTIALVAPQSVISALMAFHEEIKFSNSKKTIEKHDERLRELLLEMRKSLELPFKDNPLDFNFHLVGTKPMKEYK